ncbi:rRNA-processing protein EFG1 [Termitomyces sp. T112]|nr:rRNA-processing protein EFG1 [Termitomyces sp. T112]
MGPTRTAKASHQGEPSTSKSEAEGQRKPRRHHHNQQKEPAGLPGVQKIKSALRQARRLLAKEKLAANVKVETERRIKALEADLEQAQTSKKERTNAVRYHKVKFFERQKVVRKLNQTKKRLESADASSRPQLEETVAELRVDLNYILHYPKTKKYVSLFPPDIREDPASSETPIFKVNPDSEEVRSWIRGRMEAGEIPSDPELHLDSRVQEPKTVRQSTSEWGGGSKKKDEETPATAHKQAEPEDAFFGDDTDEE